MTKNRKLKNIIEWVKDAWLKALAILLIVTGGFYAYAQVIWPASDPNPTTGVVGMFVGESTSAFSTTTNSYAKVNDLCSSATAFPGSHVCTPDEMANSYNHGQAGIAPIYVYNSAPTLWINNGPPGFTANSNDCLGWTKTDKGTDPENPNYGAIWNFSAKAGGLSPCSTGRKFACCK